jgi:hypothetical protein
MVKVHAFLDVLFRLLNQTVHMNCASRQNRVLYVLEDVFRCVLEHRRISARAAVEYLLMPERVKKLEGQVQVLHVDLEELTGALKKFLSLDGSGQSVPESQRSMQDYVS